MSQAGNTPPPVLNLPFGQLRSGSEIYLTIPALQFLQTLWTAAIPNALTASTLPANPSNGQRAFISDCTLPAAGNFGAAAVGGGTNNVPVYWDAGAATWLIG